MEVVKLSQKFIPFEKLSKRKKREYYAVQRKGWNGVNPVTRTSPDPKVYNRKKSESWKSNNPDSDFFVGFFAALRMTCGDGCCVALRMICGDGSRVAPIALRR